MVSDSPSPAPSRRTFLKSSGLAAGLSLLAGCFGGEDGDDSGGSGDGGDGGNGGSTGDGDDTDEPIVLGGLYGFSGLFPDQSADHRDGAEYAIEEINDDGGVLGRELVLETVDTEGDPSTAVTQFTRFIEDEGIVAALGPITSDVSLQVASQAEEMEVPFLPQIAATHALTTRDSRYTFRTASHPSPGFAESAVQLIEESGFTNVAVIYADFAWGHSYEAMLHELMPDEVDLAEFTAPPTETDYTSFLRQMSEDIEVLLAAGHPPGAPNIHMQALELGLEPEIVPGAANPPGLNWDAMGEDALRGFAQYGIVDFTSDAYQSVAERYGNDTGKFMDAGDAAGYATAHLIAEAVAQAGTADRADLADSLRGISFETIFNDPIQYTEWGELEDMSLQYMTYVHESPDYYPDNEFSLEEWFRSEPLTWDPERLDL